ncbi:helix-turn-helix domain-containing protein [Lactococcus petauri]|uniref:helix-turn-helix domain-containing protein n=1 Tax=Lactococcus petauri TaxID=1940789 RepID=UPI0013FE1AA5|nr:helix-turn-helix transcriptional regulator [Lactococcus petauri]NHI77835.1 XRE family transcriptional regulator [Lactococcus petauri]
MKISYKPEGLMKNQKLDFMKYQYEEIGARIKEFRLSQGLGQDDFSETITNKVDCEEKEISIQPNVLSAIENGKIFGKNKNFLPDKTLQILSDVLKKSKEEIIFGDEKDLKIFVRKLYYQIVVNIHPVILGDLFPAYLADIFPKLKDFLMTDEFKFKNPKLWLQQATRLKLQMEGILHIGEYYYYELYEATQALQKSMLWYAPLSYVTAVDEIDGKNYYNYDRKLLDEWDDYQYYFPTRDEYASLYLTYFAKARTHWEMCSRELISSFKSKVLRYDDKIKFSDLNRRILNWVKHDFIQIMQQLEKRLRSEELYSIGYHVYDLMRPVVKAAEQSETPHGVLVEEDIQVEYFPRVWEIEHLADEVFKDSESITNDINLTSRHSEEIIKQGKKELYDEHAEKQWNREVYKEEVDKSAIYWDEFEEVHRKYYFNEGKKLIIPELLGGQRFVAKEIKNLALLQYAQTLTYMQEKYLTLMGREEFIKYFNVED